MSASEFRAKTAAMARALEDAAVLSLCGRGLVVHERGEARSTEHKIMPYATISVREDCDCGLADNNHQFIVSIHVRGFHRRPKEVIQLTHDAERAVLTAGTHLRNWQILHIDVERTRIFRHIDDGWVGCISVRVLLAPKESGISFVSALASPPVH